MIQYKIVSKIMCSLECGYASEGSEKQAFQRCVNLDVQNNRQGLFKTKITFY